MAFLPKRNTLHVLGQFSESSNLLTIPPEPGVYVLFHNSDAIGAPLCRPLKYGKKAKPIFIDETTNLRKRIGGLAVPKPMDELAVLRKRAWILGYDANVVGWELLYDPDLRRQRVNDLIEELKPPCNLREATKMGSRHIEIIVGVGVRACCLWHVDDTVGLGGRCTVYLHTARTGHKMGRCDHVECIALPE